MKLEVTNFKGIKGTKIFEAEKFNIFETKNGTGKTTLLDAIKFSFTGIAPDDPIYKGETSAAVSLEIDGMVISRKLTLKEGICSQTVKINGNTISQKALREFMEKKYGENYFDVCKVIFNPILIKNMDVNEITALLLKIIPSSIESKRICDRIPEKDLSMDEKFILMGDMKDVVTLDDIAILSEKYASLLKNVKTELKTLESSLLQVPAVPQMSYEDCEAALDQIALYERDKVAYEKAIRDYDNILKKNEEKREKIRKLEEELKGLPDTEPDQTEGVSIDKEINEINTFIQSNVASASAIGNNLRINREMINSLNTSICPLSDKLVCMTDKTPLKKEMEVLISANEAELNRLLKERSELEGRLELLKIKLDKFNRARLDHKTFISYRREIEVLEGSIALLPEKPAESQFDDYSVRKSELESIKNTWIVIHGAETTKKRIDKLKKNKEGLSHLVSVTKEKGLIREIIMSIAITPLNEAINDIAHKYNPDFDIRFEQDNGIRIKCQTGKEKPILNISSLSDGEKNIFSFFVIDVICSFMDLKKILIMDSLDDLDDENFEDMLKTLKAADYDYIFVARCR